jgi:transglutaminase-like putative cysteine protease
MNIPARYCTGYLGDIGVPVDINPMDFSAWAEVFLDGRWYRIDARHNHPRIGRIAWDAVVTLRTSRCRRLLASPISRALRW